MNATIDNKILIVTYEPAVGKSVKRILEKLGISDIEIVNTIDAARESLNHRIVDMVITDWNHVDGAAVVGSAREKNIPRIVVMDGGLAPHEALLACGVEIVAKPFSHQDIIDLVREKISKV